MRFSKEKNMRVLSLLRILFLAILVSAMAPDRAQAHFSYSDPRIIHLAERDGETVILLRMPAPLALLPEDWKGADDPRVPPFGRRNGDAIALDSAAVVANDAGLRTLLRNSVSLLTEDRQSEMRVEQYRFWSDDERPRFGTLKTAFKAFDAAEAEAPPSSYFDLTLDVMIVAPDIRLADNLRLVSQLGHQFQVMDKFGTVIKLYRTDARETRAAKGTLDAAFPAIATRWDILRAAALSGAEHIYRGADHLAIILLIAIAGSGWRSVLSLASAFTVGHMATLVAGLYRVAPAAAWFVPVVETAIAASILVAGLMIFFQRRGALNAVGLLVVGMIHGYGFAASAAEALFAGPIDPMVLGAFAVGLELCQLAIYVLVLPMILLADRSLAVGPTVWRRTVGLGIALIAVPAIISRLSGEAGLLASV